MANTKVVRLRREDVERIHRLCGLPPSAPFARKAAAVLNRAEAALGGP